MLLNLFIIPSLENIKEKRRLISLLPDFLSDIRQFLFCKEKPNIFKIIKKFFM